MPTNRWPIVREGIPFLIPSLILTLLLLWLGWAVLFVPAILLTLFTAYFFRNPKRKISSLPNIVVSPADGRVIEVRECEENRFLKKNALKISIFMSPFDVHVNRAPVSGKILQASYHPGKFLVASRDKASLLNEQNALVIETEDQSKILLLQIAGFIARRIVCHAKQGDLLNRGEIFGMIRFGSRVDLFLPLNVRPLVRVGQHIKGGESIVGYFYEEEKNIR